MPLHCPTGNTPTWNYHPRVFLDVADTGEVKCPYCGTVYKLKPGTVLKGHH
ncbi:Zinc-finger domain protein [compost metagenome]